MKSSRIRPLTGVVVLAGVMIAAAGGPSAAAEGVACSGRQVAVSNASRLEGAEKAGNSLVFVVATTGCGVASVQFRTVAGPKGIQKAIEGVDYLHTWGTLVWTKHDTSTRKILVQLVGESLVEYDEWLNFELYGASPGVILRAPTGVGTIVNDDIVMVSPDSEPDCLAAQDRCTLKVKASAKASYDLLVPFFTSDGTATADDDYVPVTQGMIVIPAGSLSGTASVALRPERVMSGPEYFYTTIFEPPPGNRVFSQRAIIPVQ